MGNWVPGLKVSPFLTERQDYETNVFQVPTGAQADVIYRTIPGFLIDYTAGPHSLSAGYRAEILRFVDLGSQNTEHHFGVGQFRLDFPRLLVNLRNDFAFTSDPPGTELTGRIESTTNILTPEVEYRLTDRFSTGVNYEFTHVKFERRVAQLNRDEHLFGGSVFWKFLPKTDLRLNYSHSEKDFATSARNVTRNLVTLGLRGDLTAKLSSTFRIGFESREPERRGLNSFNGLVTDGDWTYRPTDRTTISLFTNRGPAESIFFNSLFFVTTSGTLLANHQFNPKLSANLRLTGGLNEYPTKVSLGGRPKFRQDTLFGWGAGAEYDIQPWLRVGGEYSHTRRDSNFSAFDFKDDKITGKITLQF